MLAGNSDIDNLISKAQQDLAAAESRSEGHLSKPSERRVYNNYVNGITQLISFLHSEGHIVGMNESQRFKYQHDLSSLRADYVSLYHSDEANALAKQQMWPEAMQHLKEALQFLQTHGPSNDHVRAAYSEVVKLYKQVLNRQIAETVDQDNVSSNEEQAVAGQ